MCVTHYNRKMMSTPYQGGSWNFQYRGRANTFLRRKSSNPPLLILIQFVITDTKMATYKNMTNII